MTEKLNKLAEAINSLPDHPLAYLILQAPLHEVEGGCRVADLKALIADWERRGEALAQYADSSRWHDCDVIGGVDVHFTAMVPNGFTIAREALDQKE